MTAAKKVEDSRVQSFAKRNNRILVVDDEVNVANSYRDILCPESDNVVPINSRSSRGKKTDSAPKQIKDYQFDLTIVHSAEDAIAEVKKSEAEGRPFSMGFFDVKLGLGMDGVELVSEIYKLSPEIFAVFVTAHNDRTIESIQNILGATHDNQWDYLNKPFTRGEIIQKARNFSSLWNLNAEREEHEQQLQSLNEKLLESERMTSVSAVARGVGHEFGNILMQIMGKAELSLDKDHEGMKAGLEKVIDASQRAMEILDRFKDLSNTTQKVSEREPVNVCDIINGTIDLMEHQINIADLSVNVTSSGEQYVLANSTSLMQVFVNLIINAIHAMGEGGQLDIDVSTNEDSVVVTFKDYGPGIPEDLLYKVTEPLFTTKQEMGTGLGLAICKEITEIEHYGKFVLSNHEEKGLVVTMTLPKY